jgi:DNA-binding NarL/FixJ family response regulator
MPLTNILKSGIMEKIKVFMIDDHPSQIEGYKVILSYNEAGSEIETTACYTCESAFKIINNPAIDFDVVFLDRNMPACPELGIAGGEDLGEMIKKRWPESRLVVITSHSEAFVLYNLIKKLAPVGVLVKSDFKAQELLDAFNCYLSGRTYHSATVKDTIKQLLAKEAYLDTYNRQIIICLSQGIKTKNLPSYLNMSLSAIEKRKAQIKDYLCIGKGSDEDIVSAARRQGFV